MAKLQTSIVLEKIPFRAYLYASLALILVTTLSVVGLKNFLPPVVPILYGRPVGEGQLVPTLGLLIAPGVSFLFTIINLGLAFLVKDSFLKKILILGAFAITLLATTTVFKIIMLVGFF